LGIADDSVDIVTTRAVLAYVADKGAALREFHRVLKMGGRLSICEPIFQDDAFEAMALRKMIEARPPQALNQFLPLLHRWKAAQFPDTEELIAQNPISNFSERDLIRLVGNSGFAGIHMEFHVDIMPSLITSWEVFLGCSPHPWAPSLATILEKQFTTEERQFFEQVMRPIVETKQFVGTEHIAYITAKKLPVQTRAVH
jgi:SAM-dependent methyltransferase